jgi:hypothetical protein
MEKKWGQSMKKMSARAFFGGSNLVSGVRALSNVFILDNQ